MIPGIVVIELLDTILYATVAGIGLAVVFSLAIYGATRCADLERDDRPFAAAAAGLFALVAFLLCLGAAVAAIVVMID